MNRNGYGGESVVAYIDMILLLNFGFDGLLLYWTSLLLKKKVKYFRIALGGMIGSLFILLSFSPYYYLTNSVIAKIVVSLFMIVVVFGFHRLKIFLKACLLFYFVTFLTGGILLGIHFLFSYKFLAADTGFFYATKSYGDPVSWLFVMIGFPAAWIYSKKAFAEMEMTNVLHDGIVDVCIQIKEATLVCRGFIDTGNQLYEPFTNTPVMILSIRNVQEDIPDDVADLLNQPLNNELLSKCTESSWGDRLRVIPYKVVGSEQQLILAFRPDCIQITHDGKTGIVQRGLVAMTSQTLSHDGTYESIIHPRMVLNMHNQTAS
ncbi:MAG: sigma-E processing peptidase SpoIIGA [Bacillus sp. (in: firmicutes)]